MGGAVGQRQRTVGPTPPHVLPLGAGSSVVPNLQRPGYMAGFLPTGSYFGGQFMDPTPYYSALAPFTAPAAAGELSGSLRRRVHGLAQLGLGCFGNGQLSAQYAGLSAECTMQASRWTRPSWPQGRQQRPRCPQLLRRRLALLEPGCGRRARQGLPLLARGQVHRQLARR